VRPRPAPPGTAAMLLIVTGTAMYWLQPTSG